MVRRYALGCLGVVLLGSTADAADPNQHNWSGPYLGVTAGAARGAFDPSTTANGGGAGFLLTPAEAVQVTAAGQQKTRTDGFTAGVEGGYNWQFGRFVFGIEGDLQSLRVDGKASSGSVPLVANPADPFVLGSYASSEWLATVRPRVGVADRQWLYYVTGGLAVTHINTDFIFTTAGGTEVGGNVNATKAGYAVGGGIEAAVTDRVSIKAEYLHAGFGRVGGVITANNRTVIEPQQSFAVSSDFEDRPVARWGQLPAQRHAGAAGLAIRRHATGAVVGSVKLENRNRGAHLA